MAQTGKDKYAGFDEDSLARVFRDIIWGTPFLQRILRQARDLDLPDWQVVSGALYNRIWNHLTGQPAEFGIKDIDILYFDPDLSWQAEDRVIRKATPIFANRPPVEIRNQARVHLWYEQHFGTSIAPLCDVRHAICAFASKTHAVGLRLEADDALTLYAPYGLANIFAMNIIPNTCRDNKDTYERKATRALRYWPELTIQPWPKSKGRLITG